MGRPQDPVYSLPLYATTYRTPVDDDLYPQEPLPEWFRDLMHATEPCFRTLLQGARILEDWGVTADIARYQATSERLRDLATAKEGIDAALTSQQETLDLIAFRLGSARAAERLGRYQNLADEWHRYDTKTTPQYEPMDIELDEPKVGLESNRRVMTSDIDLAPPKHSYVFCQMISPVVGHNGGPYTCYDVGK
jgi:hypothetical protein